jgi:hypothetical protein
LSISSRHRHRRGKILAGEDGLAGPAPALYIAGMFVRFAVPRSALATALLAALAIASFLLLCHNYVVSLLPERRVTFAPEQIRPLEGKPSFAYVVDFHLGDPDVWRNPWSRTRFFENDVPYAGKHILLDGIQLTGGDRWAHQADRVVFATTDNTDPHTNGRRYSISYLPLCSASIGRTALLVWLGSLGGLLWLRRGRPAEANVAHVPSTRVWGLGTGAAAVMFLAGLYLNTGTMAPYGNTFIAHRQPETGSLYNIDHEEFRKTTLMLDGAPRAAWENGILHRRILVALLAWPLTKLTSFENGGLLLSTLLCAATFLGAVTWAGRRIGARGAHATAWLLALYPGFAYWFGMPYAYLAIAPLSVALVIALGELERTRQLRTVVWLSLGFGVANLAYDFLPLFAPASLLVLVGQRRWRDAACSLPLQVLPLAAWLLILRFGYQLPLSNSNTAVYSSILQAYLQIRDVPAWLGGNRAVIDILLHVFVGANFLFLPALFLAALALAPLTSRAKLTVAETALLGSALLLFLFNNLAPEYVGAWQLRGSWISRLYQPVFPVFVFFIARTWEQLDRTRRWPRLALGSAVALATLGNALVVFGPALNNPGRISELAFLKFYSHSDFGASLHYQGNLNHYGRHPWGWVPKPR